MSRARGRLSLWLERVIDADERYICAACDDRFANRGDGITHVVHCHPEYASVLAGTTIGHGRTSSPDVCPPRTVGTPTRPLVPAAGWS